MRLKEIRKERDLTQAVVASYLHITQNTYSQYENGKRQIPLEALISLARLYEVSTDYLLGLTDNDEPYK